MTWLGASPLAWGIVAAVLLAGLVVLVARRALRLRRRPHIVRVVYTSGATIDVRCVDFRTQQAALGGGLASVTWTDAWPKPLHLGVGEVAAVWQVK